MFEQRLIDLIKLPVHSTTLPSCGVTLRNHTCHHFFSRKRSRSQFLEQFGNNHSVVIPCGSKVETESLTLNSPRNFADLLQTLRKILHGEIIQNVVLHVLIIDCFSIFFWEIRMINRSNYKDFGWDVFTNSHTMYTVFGDLLDEIAAKYKCNILVTSYDSNFDKGHKSAYKMIALNDLTSVSFLPGFYLGRFDYVVYKGDKSLIWDAGKEMWIASELTRLTHDPSLDKGEV